MNLQRRRFIKSAALLAVPGIPTLGFCGASTDAASYADDATLLSLGLKKQLFFDDLLVESVQDITREFHQPRKVQQNPVISKDKPWEHVLLVRTSSYRVLRDPKDKLFKAWYSDEGWTQGLVQSKVTWPTYRDHYAYSEDGLKWVKPPLGIFRDDGQDTNIFRGDQTSSFEVFDVILDPFESDDSRRFKGIVFQCPVDKSGQGIGEQGHFVIGYSADGIHWKSYGKYPSFERYLGDVLLLNYNLDSKMYVINCRHSHMDGNTPSNSRLPATKSFFRPYYPDNFARNNKRRIFQSESSDLLHWTEPRQILAPDDDDNLDDHMYGMPQYRVGDAWVGFLNILHAVPNTMEVQLTYNLDGKRWRRVRQPWFSPGPPGSWDRFMVEISTQPIQVGDELWFYYGGNGYGHHDWYSEWWREGTKPPESMDVNKVGFFLGLAKLRMDGFCSLNAGPVREGIFVTRQLGSEGTGVFINAECGPGGYIDVEVMNQGDEVMPGYSRKEFDRFTGDTVRHQVSWQSKKSVPVDPHRRLVFYMRNAKVYSLQFSS